MPLSPEDKARLKIDDLLTKASWTIQSRSDANPAAARGVAVREFPMPGYGEADYLLYVDQMAVGVVEAKKEGSTLSGFELQTEKYSKGLPEGIPAPRKPLPFLYLSTGTETRFTNLLEPDPRSRNLFAFHQPETLARWLEDELQHPGSTVKAKIRQMPALERSNLRPAQFAAIQKLEQSLADGRPRALIQMASGGGKTYTACNFIYRLIKFAGARRILFLVDRSNLGRQTMTEFQNFQTPDDGRKFTELYNVQRLQSNKLDHTAKVCISTIQRLYSMLANKELDPELEEQAGFTLASLQQQPVTVEYNAQYPIESFDFIVTDECHRSIYNLWRQVLEYFDASLIGLTATPSKQTIGFFNKNLVMEYGFEQAVADRVNVDFDLYTIKTLISESGSTINAGWVVDYRHRQTRKVRWERADEDIPYDADELDRKVVAKDQIRTIIRTFKERLFTEIFPGRKEVPKTLIFAKDDSHAEDIVDIVREEFGKGNDFAQKITYRTGTAKELVKKVAADGTEYEEERWINSGVRAETLLNSFRNSYYPRIAVTVDMIATGTDIKPLEIVFFMRAVKSRTLFEQMKGRGTRVLSPTEIQSVTPDARAKDRFVIVDAIGLAPEEMHDTQPLDRKRNVSLEKLMEAVAFGKRDQDILSAIASRLARLDNQLTKEDRAALTAVANGQPLADITRKIVAAVDPDGQIEAAKKQYAVEEPTPEQITQVTKALLDEAARPIAHNPPLRNRILAIKKSYEQIIDNISQDQLVFAGADPQNKDRAMTLVKSFEQFIEKHKDEIEALQILYSRPYAERLTYKQVKELADAIQKPSDGMRAVTPEQLWHAYETLDNSKVHGGGGKILADIVNIVRFAVRQRDELVPREEDVKLRFDKWVQEQQSNSRRFTDEQRQWLEAIRDHMITALTIEPEDFDFVPFAQKGGLGKAYQVFGERLQPLLNELNEVLAA